MRRNRPSPTLICTSERLEARRLLSATVTSTIAPISVAEDAPAGSISLANTFDDPGISVVQFQTSLGNVDVALFNQRTPLTAQNFLNYANSGRYNGTIFHRSVPGFVVQGGGFTPNGTAITTDAPVQNEPGISNTRGTIAMAKLGGDPNSATDQFFFNLADNSQNLDQQNGGFTVFGTVLGNGMQVVDAIAALPTTDASSLNSAFNQLPVRNFTSGTPTSNNTVNENIQTGLPRSEALTYSVTSNDTSLVTPSISGNNLVLNYGAGQSGIARITVTATSADGSTASQSFRVKVTPAAGSTTDVGVGTGQSKFVRFKDADGTTSVISLRGPGTATVRFSGTGLTQTATGGGTVIAGPDARVASIDVTGTTSASQLTITGSGGNKSIDIGDINAITDLGIINAPTTNLIGDVSATGAVSRITLGTAADGSISVGAGATSLKIGTATGEDVTAPGSIASLQATNWVPSASGAGTITTGSIGKIQASKDFTTNINDAGDLGSVRAGTISGGGWSVTGNAGTVAAKTITGLTTNIGGTLTSLKTSGDITSSNLRTTGDVGTVAAKAFTSSLLYAGVANNSPNPPTSATNYIHPSTISSVTLKSYSDSDIAATTINKLNLGSTPLTTASTPTGVGAQSISSVTGTDTATHKKFRLKNVTSQSDVTTSLAAQGLTIAAPYAVQIV